MKLKVVIATITCLIISFSALANEKAFECPILSADTVKNIIDTGNIDTDPNYTLADEAGLTPAEVQAQEPTANPYDTYYSMGAYSPKLIGIGNVLAGNSKEARDRAKKIILSENEKYFTGKYDVMSGLCIYKMVEASPQIAGYPFKSKYETVVLFSITDNKIPGNIARSIQKNSHQLNK